MVLAGRLSRGQRLGPEVWLRGTLCQPFLWASFSLPKQQEFALWDSKGHSGSHLLEAGEGEG